MDDLAQRTLDEFLNCTAERTPSPGGGSVAAAAGALAAALARMVTAYSTPKDADAATRMRCEDVATRLHRADELLRALITRDAAAYADMAAAKPKRGSPATPEYRQAVLAGLAVPLEIAAACANVLVTLDDFKTSANKFLLSDLGAAAILAEAAIRAAGLMVRVNLQELGDAALATRLLAQIEAIARRGAALRGEIDAFVAAGL